MGRNRTLNAAASTATAMAVAERPSTPQQPDQREAAGGAAAAAGPAEQQPQPPGTCRRYLCYFLHRLLDFRVPELTALADMFGVPGVVVEPPAGGNPVSPFWYVHLPSETVAQQIVERAVLIRVVLEIWGEGGSFEELLESLAACPGEVKQPYLASPDPFRVVLDAWGFRWSSSEQQQLLQRLAGALPFSGPVSLTSPRHCFWLACIDKRAGNSGLPHELPTRWVFGRQVALADRSFVDRYCLPKRSYIGPTSMDAEVAFLMTNMAQVRRHGLVLDPYVGTASILIAAAARGAYTMGSDIDIRVIRMGKTEPGTGRRLDIYSNYEQYGLPAPLGLLRMDVHTHPFRRGLSEVFDAILGDPPYGVRAGGRKSVAKPVVVADRGSYIPSTEPYSLTECLADLLELAAVLLKPGGRLVFFMPSSPDTYREDQLPAHPSLTLLDNTEQFLTSRYSRRLVTMAKSRPYDAAEAAAFKASRAGFLMDIDRLPQVVWAQEDGKAAARAAARTAAAGDAGSAAADEQQQQQQQQGEGNAEQGVVVTRALKPRFRSKMI